VYQILFVPHQLFCYGERIAEVTGPDEMKRRNDGDATLPETLRKSETVERRTVARLQMATDDLRRRKIDEILVVDPVGMCAIVLVNQRSVSFIRFFVPVDKQQETQQPVFMPPGRQKSDGFIDACTGKIPAQLPEQGHADSAKHIPFSILSGSGFKESTENFRPLRIGKLFEPAAYFSCHHIGYLFMLFTRKQIPRSPLSNPEFPPLFNLPRLLNTNFLPTAHGSQSTAHNPQSSSIFPGYRLPNTDFLPTAHCPQSYCP